MVLASAGKASAVTSKVAPALRTAAMPSNDKLAMARLLSASTANASSPGKSASGPAGRRSHLAGVY